MAPPTPENQIWNAYLTHRAGLYAYARSIMRNAHTAQDVVHDAVVNAVQARAPARDHKAYLYRAVRNRAFRVQERNGREHALDANDLSGVFLPAPGLSADQQFIADETHERLLSALSALSGDDREVIVLHIFAGFKFREMATLLELPMGTITSRYRRALEKLSQSMKELNHAT